MVRGQKWCVLETQFYRRADSDNRPDRKRARHAGKCEHVAFLRNKVVFERASRGTALVTKGIGGGGGGIEVESFVRNRGHPVTASRQRGNQVDRIERTAARVRY